MTGQQLLLGLKIFATALQELVESMALCFGVAGAARGLARQARLRTTTQARLRTTTTTTTKTKRGKFEKVYKMTGRGEACAASVSVRGHRILTDTPKLSGGKDGAAQPVELVLAALIGCETATAHFVARQLGDSHSLTVGRSVAGRTAVNRILERLRAASRA